MTLFESKTMYNDKSIAEYASAYIDLLSQGICSKFYALASIEPLAGPLWWMTVNGFADHPIDLLTEYSLEICELGDIFLEHGHTA